jgi:hypothetical protein
MPATFELIESYTLPSAQVSYTFNNIPQTYTDLCMIANVRTSAEGGYIGFEVRFNGQTNNQSNYGFQWGTSGTPIVYSETNTGSMNIAGSTGSRWLYEYELVQTHYGKKRNGSRIRSYRNRTMA